MSKSNTISLSPHCETILHRVLENGRFKSTEEVLSAALQLLDDEERKIAALEHTEDALIFSSGMAAISTTLLAFLKKGDHKGRGNISSDMLPIPLRVFVPQ